MNYQVLQHSSRWADVGLSHLLYSPQTLNSAFFISPGGRDNIPKSMVQTSAIASHGDIPKTRASGDFKAQFYPAQLNAACLLDPENVLASFCLVIPSHELLSCYLKTAPVTILHNQVSFVSYGRHHNDATLPFQKRSFLPFRNIRCITNSIMTLHTLKPLLQLSFMGGTSVTSLHSVTGAADLVLSLLFQQWRLKTFLIAS